MDFATCNRRFRHVFVAPKMRAFLHRNITVVEQMRAGVLNMNVPLCMLCTAFYINMREGMPEYAVKLEY